MAVDYVRAARQAARAEGLDPNIFQRQINAESGFNPNSGSSAGAVGIAQFMPSTARSLGINPRDPIQSLRGAAKLMASYVKKYGSYHDALVAYIAGPGRVGEALPSETRAYIAKILPNGRDPKALGTSSGSTTSTTTTPAHVDVASAIVDAMLHPHGTGQILNSALARVNTGAYTTAASTKTTTTTPGSSAPSTSSGGHKIAEFEGTHVASWMVPALQYARAHGWKGQLTSGVRTKAEQAHLYDLYTNHGGNIAAKPGESNHEIENGGAFDATEAQQLNDILQHFSGHRPIWAPTVGLNDSVHFSLTGH